MRTEPTTRTGQIDASPRGASVFSSLLPAGAIAVFGLAAVGLPLLVLGTADQFLLAYMAIVCVLAVSLHSLMGIAGLFSLGQAAFFGVGAYVGVVLMHEHGLDGAIALPLVAMAGALVGVLMAVATFRASDLYLALTTLAFGFIGGNIVRNFDSLGGAMGFAGLDMYLFGRPLDEPKLIYWVAISCLLLLITSIVSMRRSKIGRALMASRESPVAARSIGIHTRRYRLLAFSISGAFVALMGSLYTAYAYVIDPTVFGLTLTITILTIVIVGGLRSLTGVLAAAVLFTWFRNAVEGEAIADYVLLVYASLVVLALLVLPQGLGGLASDVLRKARRTA